MAYDRTSYLERRGEERMARLNEQSYQRSLARAASGEMAAAQHQGYEAAGLGDEARYQQSLDRARSGEMTLAQAQGREAVRDQLPEFSNLASANRSSAGMAGPLPMPSCIDERRSAFRRSSRDA